jgi:hypothetical protein|tara:strand:+ start:8010 stop:9053 length:1044 start_codon:yes stop_codon:yes gene_type:complete
MNFELLYLKQEYLLYLAGVMIVAGIMKDSNYLNDFYQIIASKIKSKRLIVFLISLITGILPIPGRVTVSAGILDTLAPDKKLKKYAKSRSKFGIIDYLATHHYYLWSPLEKTIILPMAVLGLTYAEMLSYTLGLLIISVSYILWYIFGKMEEKDIILTIKKEQINWMRLITGALPLFVAIGLLVGGIEPWIVFGSATLYYIVRSSTYSLKTINSYVNWNLILTLAVIIILSNIIKIYYNDIETFLRISFFDMATIKGFIIVSAIAYGSSFVLGSSSKYAGIVALLAAIYGLEYLTWFIALEFSAYLISPTHKCTHIGRMYFGTTLKKYYAIVSLWTVIMIGYAYLII